MVRPIGLGQMPAFQGVVGSRGLLQSGTRVAIAPDWRLVCSGRLRRGRPLRMIPKSTCPEYEQRRLPESDHHEHCHRTADDGRGGYTTLAEVQFLQGR
jgi:hypothetical protein